MHSYNTGRIAWRSKYNINSLTFYIISLLPQNPNAILSKSTELLSCSSYWFFMSHLITRVICNQFITFKSPPFQRLEQEKLYLLLSNSFWLFQCKLLYSWPFKKKKTKAGCKPPLHVGEAHYWAVFLSIGTWSLFFLENMRKLNISIRTTGDYSLLLFPADRIAPYWSKDVNNFRRLLSSVRLTALLKGFTLRTNWVWLHQPCPDFRQHKHHCKIIKWSKTHF